MDVIITLFIYFVELTYTIPTPPPLKSFLYTILLWGPLL